MAQHADRNNDLEYRRLVRARRATKAPKKVSRKDVAAQLDAARQDASQQGHRSWRGQTGSFRSPVSRSTYLRTTSSSSPQDTLAPLTTSDFTSRKKKMRAREELAQVAELQFEGEASQAPEAEARAERGTPFSREERAPLSARETEEAVPASDTYPDEPLVPGLELASELTPDPTDGPAPELTPDPTDGPAPESADEPNEQPPSSPDLIDQDPNAPVLPTDYVPDQGDFSDEVNAPLTAFPASLAQRELPEEDLPSLRDRAGERVAALKARIQQVRDERAAKAERAAQESVADSGELIPPAHAPGAKVQQMEAVDPYAQGAESYERHQRVVQTRIRAGIAAAAVIFAAFIVAVVVSSVHRTIRMADLNDSAKILYEAVQANLDSLKASGQPSALVDTLDAHHLVAESEEPVDFMLVNGGVWGAAALYHAGNANGEDEEVAEAYLLAESPPDLPKGTYVVEFLPEAYEVYSVFYWEGDARGPDQTSAQDISYQTLSELPSRSEDERGNWLLGYYAGPDVGTADKAQGVNAAVVNGDELFVQLTGNTVAQIAADPNRLAKLEVEVQVTGPSRADATHKVTWLHTYSAADLSVSSSEIAVVLDSIDLGKSFSQIVDTVVPGSNITVGVTARYDGTVAATTSVKTNSLFAGYDEARGVVRISSLRHLNNLHANRRSLGSTRASTIKRLEFIGDVEFNSAGWPVGSASASSVLSGAALSSFEPLTAFELAGIETVNGLGHEIRGLVINKEAENCGLFATANFSISDLTLRDPNVHGRSAVGALAGQWQSGTITNCHVKTTDGTVSHVSASDRSVGGLVGELGEEAEMHECSAVAEVSGKSYAGGLVGLTESDSLVQNCVVGYVEDPAAVATPAEGEVGEAGANAVQPGDSDDGEDEQEEAALPAYTLERPAKVSTDEDYAGGAFGQMGGTAENVRVLANVEGAEHVGGFAGMLSGPAKECEVNSPVLKGSNTPDDLLADANCTVTSSGGTAGGFAGEQGAKTTDCHAHVDVIAHGDNVGGFSGLSSASLVGCGVCGMVAPAKAPANMRSDLGSNRSARVGVESNGNNVGGLVGMHEKGDLEGCFSSANVAFAKDNASADGGYNYGGLIGRQDGGEAESCYASGDVGGKASVGGLVGRLRNGSVTDVYTCGVIIGDEQVGGVIGYGDNTEELVQCWGWARVYANGEEVDAEEALARHESNVEEAEKDAREQALETGETQRVVTDAEEEQKVTDHLTGLLKVMSAGGVIGETGSDQCAYKQCAYLAFRGYNDYFDPLVKQPAYFSYEELVSQAKGKELSLKQSHPIGANLGGKAYPFAPLWYDGEPMPHYGNWPVEGETASEE